jgi:succinate dehydrogenase / fumarate reductase cytochrome b subunit
VLTRAHSLLGVVPLTAFLCVHVFGQLQALEGRERWLDAALHPWARGWLVALVLVPLLAHAALGVARLLREPPPADPLLGPPSLRTLQAITGGLSFVFIAYHVGTLWGGGRGPHASERDAYALLWQTAGRPFDLAIYVVGMAAVCLHVAHGWSRAAVTFGVVRSPREMRFLRLGAGVIGFVLLFLLLEVFAHFAIGQALVAPPGS